MASKSSSSRRLSEKTVFVSKNGKYTVKEVVDLVNGTKVTKLFREGKGSGSVSIIALLDKDTLLLERQYRPAVRDTGAPARENGWLYELPGGKFEKGEKIREAAIRELEEETGYRASKVTFLYNRYIAPWLTDGIDHVCMAEGLVKTKTHRDPDEIITLVPMKISRVKKMLKAGKMKDLATSDALLHWLTFNNVSGKSHTIYGWEDVTRRKEEY